MIYALNLGTWSVVSIWCNRPNLCKIGWVFHFKIHRLLSAINLKIKENVLISNEKYGNNLYGKNLCIIS